MKKSRLYALISYVLLFIIYNILVWMIMPKGSANFWIGYIATAVAFIICVMVIVFADKSGNDRTDALVKGMSIIIVSIGFLCVQIVFGLVVMLLPRVLTKAIIVAEIILFLIFGVIILWLESAKRYSDKIDGANDSKADLRTEMVNMLQKLYRNTDDGETQSLLIELTDRVKSCDGKILLENDMQLLKLINQMKELINKQQYSPVKEVIKEIKVIL